MSGPQKERHVEARKAAYTSFGVPAVLLEMVCSDQSSHNFDTLLIKTSYRSQSQVSSSPSPTHVARLSGQPIWSLPGPLHQGSRSRQRRQSKSDSGDVFLIDHSGFGNMCGNGPTGTTGDFEAPAYPCLILQMSALLPRSFFAKIA